MEEIKLLTEAKIKLKEELRKSINLNKITKKYVLSSIKKMNKSTFDDDDAMLLRHSGKFSVSSKFSINSRSKRSTNKKNKSVSGGYVSGTPMQMNSNLSQTVSDFNEKELTLSGYKRVINDFDKLKEEFAIFQQENFELNKKVENYEQMKDKIESLLNDISNLKEINKRYDEAVHIKNNEISVLKEQLNNSVKNYENTLDILNSIRERLKNSENERNEMKIRDSRFASKVESMENELSSFRKNNATLQKTTKSLMNKIKMDAEDFNLQNEKKEEFISVLNDKLAKLQEKITYLSSSYNIVRSFAELCGKTNEDAAKLYYKKKENTIQINFKNQIFGEIDNASSELNESNNYIRVKKSNKKPINSGLKSPSVTLGALLNNNFSVSSNKNNTPIIEKAAESNENLNNSIKTFIENKENANSLSNLLNNITIKAPYTNNASIASTNNSSKLNQIDLTKCINSIDLNSNQDFIICHSKKSSKASTIYDQFGRSFDSKNWAPAINKIETFSIIDAKHDLELKIESFCHNFLKKLHVKRNKSINLTSRNTKLSFSTFNDDVLYPTSRINTDSVEDKRLHRSVVSMDNSRRSNRYCETYDKQVENCTII